MKKPSLPKGEGSKPKKVGGKQHTLFSGRMTLGGR